MISFYAFFADIVSYWFGVEPMWFSIDSLGIVKFYHFTSHRAMADVGLVMKLEFWSGLLGNI